MLSQQSARLSSILDSARPDKNHVAYVNDEITKIAGQRPVITKAKLSISNFKLREGQPIGCKVPCVAVRCMISLPA